VIQITIRRVNWFLFFRRYEVNDDAGLNYSIQSSPQEIQLKRDSKLIFSGDVYEKTYFDGSEMKVSRISSPKSFKFNDNSDIDYCKPTKINGRVTTKILYKGKFLAEVFYRNNWSKLSEDYNIKIFSDDKDVVDKVIFAFMHDYNFNQMYFGT